MKHYVITYHDRVGIADVTSGDFRSLRAAREYAAARARELQEKDHFGAVSYKVSVDRNWTPLVFYGN